MRSVTMLSIIIEPFMLLLLLKVDTAVDTADHAVNHDAVTYYL
jgi:hypothetical protein